MIISPVVTGRKDDTENSNEQFRESDFASEGDSDFKSESIDLSAISADSFNTEEINTRKVSTGCGTSPPRELKGNDLQENILVSEINETGLKNEVVVMSTGTSPPPQDMSTQVFVY